MESDGAREIHCECRQPASKTHGNNWSEKFLPLPIGCGEGIKTSLFNGHDQVFHDVIFALGSILAHVEVEDGGGFRFGGILDLAEAHIRPNELFKFARVNFSQALEAGDLSAFAKLLGGFV